VKARKAANDPNLADAEALSALARGDVSALGVIYDRHRAAIFQFVSRATGNAADVEDIVHATFITATKAAATFDGRASCRPWLLGIAGRLVHRRQRSLSRFGRALRELTLREAQRSIDPANQLDARDGVAQVAAALEELTEPKRVVLLLADVESLACQEIADALEIPIGTVWTRLHHARKELRELVRGRRS
jgi:RNA polymerase sigma-70 factor (ECF subfamily)